MFYVSVGMDSRQVMLTQRSRRMCSSVCCPNGCALTSQTAAQKMPVPVRLALLGRNPWPRSISFVPQLATEPRLTGTDPSPGQSLAAAIYLVAHVWSHLFPSQLLFPRAYSQRICQPTRFALARERGQPSGFPWEVILGRTGFTLHNRSC